MAQTCCCNFTCWRGGRVSGSERLRSLCSCQALPGSTASTCRLAPTSYLGPEHNALPALSPSGIHFDNIILLILVAEGIFLASISKVPNTFHRYLLVPKSQDQPTSLPAGCITTVTTKWCQLLCLPKMPPKHLQPDASSGGQPELVILPAGAKKRGSEADTHADSSSLSCHQHHHRRLHFEYCCAKHFGSALI